METIQYKGLQMYQVANPNAKGSLLHDQMWFIVKNLENTYGYDMEYLYHLSLLWISWKKYKCIYDASIMTVLKDLEEKAYA